MNDASYKVDNELSSCELVSVLTKLSNGQEDAVEGFHSCGLTFYNHMTYLYTIY